MHKINSHKNPIAAPTETEIVHNSHFYTLYNAKFKENNGNYLSIILPEQDQEYFDIQTSPRIRLRLAYRNDLINLSSMKYFSFLASFGKLAYLDLSNKPL